VIVTVTVVPAIDAGEEPAYRTNVPDWLGPGNAVLFSVYVPEVAVLKVQVAVSPPTPLSTRDSLAVFAPVFV
jgi:hypothetical protein